MTTANKYLLSQLIKYNEIEQLEIIRNRFVESSEKHGFELHPEDQEIVDEINDYLSS